MNSENFKHWISEVDSRRCIPCKKMHGKIYFITEKLDKPPPLHFNCRCKIKKMIAIQAGLATDNREDGADYWLKEYGRLPDYYVTRKDAWQAGWKSKMGNFDTLFPGKMMAGGIYKNDDSHLPEAVGRVWYEVDVNYINGYRNSKRILYSSDGLIFITYDHYHTFYEIL